MAAMSPNPGSGRRLYHQIAAEIAGLIAGGTFPPGANLPAERELAARLKISSQRKIILEGSQEWDILYRKYYNDEVKKLGL